MSMWYDVCILPAPSADHATCAWCGHRAPSIVALIDHVDELHLDASAVDRRDVA